MKDIGFFNKIYLVTSPVDFRKQAHGLAVIVEHTLGHKQLNDRVIFAFTNKRMSSIKLLYWDATGFALWWKTLESDKFRWPKSKDDCMNLETKELRWLLEGIDLNLIKKHKRVTLD